MHEEFDEKFKNDKPRKMASKAYNKTPMHKGKLKSQQNQDNRQKWGFEKQMKTQVTMEDQVY